MKSEELTVVELFAGVGGFRLGLEKSGWKTIFANQWEPGKKNQWAFDCYQRHFPDSVNLNIDIAQVPSSDIPDCTLLVGGFPCQDYSVASTLANSKGIEGKKGVLWWEIDRIVEAKRPRFILLENVDRLLKSPASQRGRDFAIILSCLSQKGYNIEWRVINAADYGFQQRRRRTFIFATLDDYNDNAEEQILTSGFFARIFPAKPDSPARSVEIGKDLLEITKSFSFDFASAGFCHKGKCTTIALIPAYDGERKTLGELLEKNVDEKYFISQTELPKWEYMKGAKREKRVAKTGFEYWFSEGPVAFPDHLDQPARTMLTSEGSKNRSSHVICDPEKNRLRILTPVECERIDGFPDNWTEGMPERTRYFCMGNALVVPLIELMGQEIAAMV